MAEPNSERGELPYRAYLRLRDLIIRGRIPPGERVVEAEIALRFGISRTPVRQALARLEQEGYIQPVRIARRTERIVAPLSVDEVLELWGIIGSLESHAVETLIGRSALLRERIALALDRINGDLETAARGRPRDPDLLFQLQTRFHRTFFDAGAGPRLRAIYDGVRPHVERYEWIYGAQPGAEMSYSTGEHERIIQAIRTGDKRAAKDSVENHWGLAAARTSAVIREVAQL